MKDLESLNTKLIKDKTLLKKDLVEREGELDKYKVQDVFANRRANNDNQLKIELE